MYVIKWLPSSLVRGKQLWHTGFSVYVYIYIYIIYIYVIYKPWLRGVFRICDQILENHPYGCILHIKYLGLKSGLKFLFFLIYGSNTVKMFWITRKSVEIFKMCFCDVRSSKIVINLKKIWLFQVRPQGWFSKVQSHIYNLSPRSEFGSGFICGKLPKTEDEGCILCRIHQSCHGSYVIYHDVHHASQKHTIRALANLTKVLTRNSP